MEDAHCSEISLPKNPTFSVFGVFDGHGGSTVAVESARRFIRTFSNHYNVAKKNMEDIITSTFIAIDDDLRESVPTLGSLEDRSGSTATVAIITESHIHIANCGDSRTVLVRAGQAEYCTTDHKPTTKTESDRITDAGGYVEMGRVCGNLSTSRSLGDFFYKERGGPPLRQKVIAVPDVKSIERVPQDEFLILACDGVWDVLSIPEAIEFVHSSLKAGLRHKAIVEKMLDHCCLTLNSKDNLSATIVFFPASSPIDRTASSAE